jgi:hypothetical protein
MLVLLSCSLKFVAFFPRCAGVSDQFIWMVVHIITFPVLKGFEVLSYLWCTCVNIIQFFVKLSSLSKRREPVV